MTPTPTLPVLDPLATFVDVGSQQMFVSIAGGPPEVFGAVTTELHRLRDWLQERGVKSVAMESHRRLLAATLRRAGGGRF